MRFAFVFVALFCTALTVSATPPLNPANRNRILDCPKIFTGQKGWSVEPRVGQLTLAIPMTTSPGKFPISMGLGVYATPRALFHADWQWNAVTAQWTPQGGQLQKYPTQMLPMIGMILGREVFGDINYGQDKEYCLENGVRFRDYDLESCIFPPNANDLLSAYGILLTDYGAPPKKMVHRFVAGDVVVVSDLEAGDLDTVNISITYPSGFKKEGQSWQFAAVIDKEVMRLFCFLSEDNVWVPVLWRDRFGNCVTLTWTSSSDTSGTSRTVQVSLQNAQSVGYKVTWHSYASPGTDKPLINIAPIGFTGNSLTVSGTAKEDSPQIFPDLPASVDANSTFVVRAPFLEGRAETITYGSDYSWSLTYDPQGRLKTLAEPGSISTTFTYADAPIRFGYEKPVAPPADPTINMISQDLITFADVTGAKTAHSGSTLDQAWQRNNDPISPTVITASSFNSLGTDITKGVHTILSYSEVMEGNSTLCKSEMKRGAEVLQQTNFSYKNIGIQGLPAGSGTQTTFPGKLKALPTITVIERGATVAYRIERTKLYANAASGSLLVQEKELIYQDSDNPTYPPLSGRLTDSVLIDGTAVQNTTLKTKITYSELAGSKYKAVPEYTWRYVSDTFKAGTHTTYKPDGSLESEQSELYDNSPTGVKGAKTKYSADATWGTTKTVTLTAPDDAETLLSKSDVTQFDNTGLPKTVTQYMGSLSNGTTTNVWDSYGRLRSNSLNGVTTSYGYAALSKTISRTGQGSSTEEYDGFGRLALRTFADDSTESYAYDETDTGSKVTLTRSNGTCTTRLLDDLGRVVSESTTGTTTVTYAYAVDGALLVTTATQSVGGNDAITKTWTNLLGRVVKTQDAAGTVTTYAYDVFGNIVSTQQNTNLDGTSTAATQTRSKVYDGLGRLSSTTDPEVGTTIYYGFTVDGKPQSVLNFTGKQSRTRCLTYDAYGRLLTRASEALITTLSYTDPNNPFDTRYLRSASTINVEPTTGQATNTYTVNQSYDEYDTNGRLLKESIEGPCFKQSIGYGYNSRGQLNLVTYPSGLMVKYDPDVIGRVENISLKQGGSEYLLANLTVGPSASVRKVNFASGTSTDFGLDAQGRPGEWKLATPAGTVRSGSYTFDSERGLMSSAGDWTGLSYDKLGRIKTANTSAAATAIAGTSIQTTHGHDVYDNNVAHSVTVSAMPSASQLKSWSYTPGTDNRLPSASTGWIYNDLGEAETVPLGVSSGSSLALRWDGLGRLQAASSTTANIAQAYGYAPSGLRYSQTCILDPNYDRKYVYTSAGLLLSEFNGYGQWKRDVIYLGSLAIAEVDANGIHELHLDHLGTPKLVTNAATGQVEAELLYGPYGELVAYRGAAQANGASYANATYLPLTGYTGHVAEDPRDGNRTGLIYMRGRYYSPVWHRFVNSDRGVDPLNPNQYAYVGGNPFLGTDPSGMVEWDGEEAVDVIDSMPGMMELATWERLFSASVAYLSRMPDHPVEIMPVRSPQTNQDRAQKYSDCMQAAVDTYSGELQSIPSVQMSSGSGLAFARDAWSAWKRSSPVKVGPYKTMFNTAAGVTLGQWANYHSAQIGILGGRAGTYIGAAAMGGRVIAALGELFTGDTNAYTHADRRSLQTDAESRFRTKMKDCEKMYGSK